MLLHVWAGGTVYLITNYFQLPEYIQYISTVTTVITIRLLAVKFKLQLPIN